MKEEKGAVVVEYLNRYPNAYKRTIAQILVSERPDLFSSVEEARNVVRYYTDSQGSANRARKKKYTVDERIFNRLFPDHEQYPDDIHLKKGKALIISDIHSHHMTERISEYFEKADKENVNTIILNGDIMDMESMSKWPQFKRHQPFQEELDFMHELLDDIAVKFPHARKIYKKGNHELWMDRQLWSNPKLMEAKDIADMLCIENILNLKEKNIEVVQDRQLINLGRLLLVHGHEAKKGGMYIAKAMMEYFKRDVAFGHFHRVDYHQYQPYGKPLMRSYGLPCACKLTANYTGVNNQWKNGFAICEWDEENYAMDVYIEDEGRIRRM
jgi:predicted phosphodiesterase